MVVDLHRDPASSRFVEELGLLAEDNGWMPRTAGRTLGLLLVAGRPLSQPEICTELQISTGSVSTVTRLLIEKRLIRRVAHAGERKVLFEVPEDVWTAMEEDGQRVVRRYRALADSTLASLGSDRGAAHESLTRMSRYFQIVDDRMQAVLHRLASKDGSVDGVSR